MSAFARSLGLLFAGSLLLFPLEAVGQDPVPGDIFRALSLDSLAGEVPVYYSPGHAERARTLQEAYGGAVAHYRAMFGGEARADLTTSLALLEPDHWTAFTSSMPYGAAHIDFRGWPRAAVAVLPATNDQGVTAGLFRGLGYPPADMERAVDAVGFHEFGHLLMRQYFYGTTLATRAFSVRWFEEFMATYLGMGYLWHTDGMALDPIRTDLLDAIPDSLLRYTSLADFEARPLEEFLTPEGWANYGWYQGQFADRGRQVFEKQGLAFIARVREELPWDRYTEWRTGELLGWLEAIEPGFLGWARSLERRSTAEPPPPPLSGPFYPEGLDAPMLARLVDGHLAEARAAVERLVAAADPRTSANTLRPFDDAHNHLTMAQGLAAIATQVHPDSAVRAEGLLAEERIGRLRAELQAEPRVARAFEALDTTGLDAEERGFAARVRRDFRRSGADRDEATRKRLRSNFEALQRLGARFSRNIAEDTATFLATEDELAEMPAEWVAAHARDREGRVVLTSSWTDYGTITTYTTNRSLRMRTVVAFTNRGWPANAVVLDSLLRLREATAHLLGYRDWASYQTETRMAASPDSVRAFLDRVRAAYGPAHQALAARFLERLRREDPTIAVPMVGDFSIAAELIRREEHALDRGEIRAYFPFQRVKAGLLDLAAEMFELEFRRVDVPVWHPSVEAYEAWEDGRPIGRFYLDLHPRSGKLPLGATFDLRPGIAGRQLPEALLVAQVPGGDPGDPGLLDHAGLTGGTVLFHELGHVLHFLFAVRPYASTGGWPDELDFVEVPSLMLEEWLWQPAVLRRITRHVETGAPIPDDLVDRMRAAEALDRVSQAASYTAASAISLALHDRPAAGLDPDSLARRAFAADGKVELGPDVHFPTSFEHLGHEIYAATFYTFLWSQVIAKDLWSVFEAAAPLDPGPARRYRDLILRPGRSRPAAELVRDFLGRPFDFASWQRGVEAGTRSDMERR
jgi:thimet oligopeptidase